MRGDGDKASRGAPKAHVHLILVGHKTEKGDFREQ